MTSSLLDAVTIGEVLQQITDTRLSLVRGADLVSVTLRAPDGTFHTPCHTEIDRSGEAPPR